MLKALSISIITSLGLFYAPATLAGEDSPSWSYGGADNPTQWGRLGDDFAACELGRDQSPIDINIDEAIKSTPAKIEFNYSSVPLVVVNNGHTVQVNYQPGSSVKIDGEEYELLQFHFHTPSEHTVSEKASAMELHLVHRNSKGELAVIGVMMEEGLANPFIDKIWQHIPLEPGVNEVEKMTFNAQDLLPKDISYVSYAGSLTTPPCSEGVKWHVLTEAIEVSPAQIANFQKLYQVNARPIQPLNGRTIKLRQR